MIEKYQILKTEEKSDNDLLSLCKREEINRTTGKYAVWVNVRGC